MSELSSKDLSTRLIGFSTIVEAMKVGIEAANEIERLQVIIIALNETIVEHDMLLSECGKTRNAAQQELAALKRAAHEPPGELPLLPKHNHAFCDPEDEQPGILVWNEKSMRAYATAAISKAALTRASQPPPAEHVIKLTPAEIQSGFDRVRWAEALIRQLPETHDGRNSWLLNYSTATKISEQS